MALRPGLTTIAAGHVVTVLPLPPPLGRAGSSVAPLRAALTTGTAVTLAAVVLPAALAASSAGARTAIPRSSAVAASSAIALAAALATSRAVALATSTVVLASTAVTLACSAVVLSAALAFDGRRAPFGAGSALASTSAPLRALASVVTPRPSATLRSRAPPGVLRALLAPLASTLRAAARSPLPAAATLSGVA
jgi:hypothetical protein